MNKTISPIILVFACMLTITSCKKQYTCECTSKVTWSSGGSSGSKEVITKDAYSEKMKEKQASSACNAQEGAVKKHVEDQVKDAYDGTNIKPNINTSCKLM